MAALNNYLMTGPSSQVGLIAPGVTSVGVRPIGVILNSKFSDYSETGIDDKFYGSVTAAIVREEGSVFTATSAWHLWIRLISVWSPMNSSNVRKR